MGLLPDRHRQQFEQTTKTVAWALSQFYASAATVGSSMLVVDAISERAAAFYEGNGFVRLPDSLRLVLPMHAIQRLVEP